MSNNLTMLLESLLEEESLEDFYKKQKSRFPKIIKQIEYLEQNQVPIKYFNFIQKQLNSTQDSIENIVNQALSADKTKLKANKPEENYFSTQKKKYPHLSKQINYLEQNKVPNKYIDWIIKQINVESPEPIEDIVTLVQAFEKNQGQLEKKNINQYENIGELHHALEDLNTNKEQELQSRTISSSDIQDVLAEKDGWFVTFPHTTEASCDLGTSTTWCTARTQSGNMFLNYVGAKKDIILFYVINPSLNPRKEPFSKMSIGYIKGEPKFNMGDNQLTVNADNKNLTQGKFIEVVGSENANLFLNAMSRKAKELGGVHPAQKEMEAISQDYDLFLKKVATYKNTTQNYKAKKEFFNLLRDKYENGTLPKIKEYVDIFFEEIEKRISAAQNPYTKPDDLTLLARDVDADVRRRTARNPNIKLTDLKILIRDNDEYVRYFAVQNPNIKPDDLTLLARDVDKDVRYPVSRNPNTKPDDLTLLARDVDKDVRAGAARNPNIKPDDLTLLIRDVDADVRRGATQNLNIKPDDLTLLARDVVAEVRAGSAQSTNIKPDDLTLLARDVDKDVRYFVAQNPNIKPDDLTLLARDDDVDVRRSVAQNLNTRLADLEFLIRDDDEDVQYFVAQNPNYELQENKIMFNSNRFKQLAGI